MAEVLRLKAELEEQEVILETADGEERKYVLKELIGKQRNKYMNLMSGRMRVSPQGKVLGFKNFDGMQADLLMKCLYREGDLVSQEEIEELPASTQQALFEKAQSLSGLDNDDQGEKDPN